MRKAGILLIIYAFVGVAYLMMSILQSFTNSIVATVNSTVNWTASPETQAVLVAWPFYIWLIPASIGLAVSVTVLVGDKK